MVLRLLWKSLVALFFFDFRDAYVLFLLACLSVAYPAEITEEEDVNDPE